MVEELEQAVALLRRLEQSGVFFAPDAEQIKRARWVIADELLHHREREEADAHGRHTAV